MKSNSGKMKSEVEKKFKKMDDMITEIYLEIEFLKCYKMMAEKAWLKAIRSYKRERENHG